MPIYEYTCSRCNEIFARFHWPGREEEIVCPQCGSDDVRKIISTFNCSNPAESGGSSGGSSYAGFNGG